ncbi:MAG: hypothetical protein ACLUN0_00225 [Roseburia sp.]
MEKQALSQEKKALFRIVAFWISQKGYRKAAFKTLKTTVSKK